MDRHRLKEQLNFLTEIDKLKKIRRRTLLLDQSRTENDAEHSWHLAMLVMTLAEYSNQPIDTLQTMKLVLIHDLVEIDAGDTYAYDQAAHHDKVEREQAAAERIFNILPQDQAKEVRALWDEFEAGETAEARFANAVDRFQPLLHNLLTDGRQWKEHSVSHSQVVERCSVMSEGSESLWAYMSEKLTQAVKDGLLRS